MTEDFKNHGVLNEAASIFKLGGPLVGTYASSLFVVVIETVLIGRLGADSLAAYTIAITINTLFAFVAGGVLTGAVPLMSRAVGAGDMQEMTALIASAVRLAFVISVPFCVLAIGAAESLFWMGVRQEVQSQVRDYLYLVLWSTPATLLATVLRGVMNSSSNSSTPFRISLIGILANILLDWALIEGNLGFPGVGLIGCAIATVLARFLQLGLLVALLPKPFRTSLWPNSHGERICQITKIGIPIGVQNLAEYGVISALTLMMTIFGPIQVAAHQVARQFTSVSFMLVLGLGTAGAIRVAQFIGQSSARRARISVLATLYAGCAAMSVCAAVFAILSERLAALISSDMEVIKAAAMFIRIAAVFQLFDAVQGIATSCLRGAGDASTPMRIHVATLVFIGLPTAYIFAFNTSLGPLGLWFGLCTGLAASAGCLSYRLFRVFGGRGDQIAPPIRTNSIKRGI